MRTTLADARNSRIPSAMGLCPTEPKFLAILNEAQSRLLTKGMWFGTVAKYRICVSDGCVTLPVQISTIEKAAVCGAPIRVHDQWYEFLENGFGTRNGSPNNSTTSGTTTSSSCCGTGPNNWGCGLGEVLYRGRFCTFRDIVPSGKLLNFICDLISDVGKEVLALGYDDNGNWIRTMQSGSIQDGEVIVLAQAAGTNSVNNFSCVTDIQFPSNVDGQTWLYEYKVSDATKRLIGKYEYFEERPSYARYFFPGIRQNSNTDGSCNQSSIEIIGKLEFIPAKNDTDYLIISNIPALKAMCVGISNAEKVPSSIEKSQIIASAYVEALAELNAELNHYRGDVITGITVVGASVGMADPIPVLV